MKFKSLYEFLLWLAEHPEAELSPVIGDKQFETVDDAVEAMA